MKVKNIKDERDQNNTRSRMQCSMQIDQQLNKST